MALKTLFQTKLTDLETSDKEGLGVIRPDEYGRFYRWIKNKGATELKAHGSCLKVMATTASDVNKKVISPDGAGPSTAIVSRPAGAPVTNIAKSGSNTGCFGWVQVKGPMRVNLHGTDIGTNCAAGYISIATSTLPATGCWDVGVAQSVASDGTSYFYPYHVQLVKSITTVGAATAQSATVEVNCL